MRTHQQIADAIVAAVDQCASETEAARDAAQRRCAETLAALAQECAETGHVVHKTRRPLVCVVCGASPEAAKAGQGA